MVQIIWSIVAFDETVVTKDFLVNPQGFEISGKACNFHGISQERALASGWPLRVVLEEFMHSVSAAHKSGGRVVIHHLEYDAAIIENELLNAGLEDWVPTFTCD